MQAHPTPDHHAPQRPAARRRWPLWLATLALALQAGCAALAPATPEQQVQERAQARWQALVRNDFKAAYELLAPSLRALVPLDRWTLRFGRAATWKSVDVVRVTCEDSRCTATIRLISSAPLAGPRTPTITTHLEETWVLEDQRWWFFQKL